MNSKKRKIIIIFAVALIIVSLFGCGKDTNNGETVTVDNNSVYEENELELDHFCASCGSTTGYLVKCPWCGATVCDECALYKDEIGKGEGFVANIFDIYYVYYIDGFEEAVWEDLIKPDADSDLEAYNEMIAKYGYKLMKIDD